MSIDKVYCMSSYLAFRYIEDADKDFFNQLHHENKSMNIERKGVLTARDIDIAIADQFSKLKEEKLGILLSGGMDSAILASYMQGCDAYTFRFLGGDYQVEELNRAKYYADQYNLKLHYVDINWTNTVERYLEPVMRSKAAPVHSIEPQILQAAMQAKLDDISLMIIGESSDLIFGGMDQLLSKDWEFTEFMERYIFTHPEKVLLQSSDMSYLFERYRMGDKINFLSFMDEIFSVESSNSYVNAFGTAGMSYLDPYASLKMVKPLDLERIRNGESKYLIRELFSMKYPDISVPEKIPMPRPVDMYFENWKGPIRKEFKQNLDMSKFTGNQKWQIWCLERFLNLFDKQ